QGVLVLGSKPPCDIAIDGNTTGLHTPQKEIKLPVGRHRITLTNAEFGINETFSVDIKADVPEKLIKDYSDRLPNGATPPAPGALGPACGGGRARRSPARRDRSSATAVGRAAGTSTPAPRGAWRATPTRSGAGPPAARTPARWRRRAPGRRAWRASGR